VSQAATAAFDAAVAVVHSDVLPVLPFYQQQYLPRCRLESRAAF
jgi:hypothetical protein